MEEVDSVSGESVTVTCGVDTATAKLLRVLVREVPVVALVEDTVGVGASGADREEITFKAGAIGVDVEDAWSLT